MTTCPPRWATKEQAAQHIGVHPRTIMRWAAQGRLPIHRLGDRLVRFDLNEVDAMLTAAAGQEPS